MKYLSIMIAGLFVTSFAFAQEWPKAKKRPGSKQEQKDGRAVVPERVQRQLRPDQTPRVVQPRRERGAVVPQQNPYERIFGRKPTIPGLAELQRQVQEQQQQSNPQPVVRPPQRDARSLETHRAPPGRVEQQRQFPDARRRDPINQRSARDARPRDTRPWDTRPQDDRRVRGERQTVGQRQPDHNRLIEVGRGRTDSLMRRNPAVLNHVNKESRWAATTYRPLFEQRSPIYRRYVDSFRGFHDRYPGWSRHRFYGGGHYGFRPVFNIEIDFYNPLVYWFFVPTYSVDYYRPWYGSNLNTYSALRRPFRYSGYFYPTESLRELLFGVSAMSIRKQIAFREGIDVVTDRLSRRTTEVAYVAANLGRGDIVVTHYEMVGYERAIALEGFVVVNDRPYNFKAIVDLRYPDSSDVFVTGAMDREPTSLEIQALDRLNARFSAYSSIDTYDDDEYYDDDDNY